MSNNYPNTSEEISVKPSGFNSKRNIIIIIIAAVLLIGGGITAIAVTSSHSATSGVADKIQLAERFLSEQKYEQAIIEFQKVLEIESMNVDAYLGLADAYLGLGDTDKAIEILREGLDKTGDERIKNKLDVLRKPLTADKLSWIVEPTYEFEEVRPILQNDFVYSGNINGTNKLTDSLSGYEASFPSYSFTEEYYEIKRGDSYSLFYMPDNVISPFDSSEPLRVIHEIYFVVDHNKVDFEQVLAETTKFPWNVIELAARGGGLFGRPVWDSYTQKAYLSFDDLDYWTFKPASNLLNKNYPVQKFDLSSWGTVPQSEIFRTMEDADYDKLMSAIRKPIDSKYALWSPDDKLLTDFIYDEMSVCSYGLTAAYRDGKWGYLDENGNEITEFVYDEPWCIAKYSDGDSKYAAYPCTSDTMVVSLDGELGVLYRDGRLLIGYGQFEDLAPAWNNQLWAKSNGKWGLIDLKSAKKSFGITFDDASSGDQDFIIMTSTQTAEP